MIRTFADKETEDVFEGIHSHGVRKKFSSELVIMSQHKMDMLNCADSLDTLRKLFPGNPEPVVRDAHETYSIPISGNYRLAFRWDKGDAFDLKIK